MRSNDQNQMELELFAPKYGFTGNHQTKTEIKIQSIFL